MLSNLYSLLRFIFHAHVTAVTPTITHHFVATHTAVMLTLLPVFLTVAVFGGELSNIAHLNGTASQTGILVREKR